jgi:putative ABC transport system permease protein
LAVLGVIGGAPAGLLYTKAMIYGLATVWQDAVTGSVIRFYARPSTILTGALGGVIVSLIAVGLTLHTQLRRPARELLAAVPWQFFSAGPGSKGRIGLWVAAVAIVGAVILLGLMASNDGSAAAGAFFGAGALLLVAELGLTGTLLGAVAGGWSRPVRSLGGLGLRNSTRRSGRSLAVVGLLAAGSFLVIAVGANRHGPAAQAHRRDSGTGGFALFGESAIPVLHDLSSERGRKSAGLDDAGLEDVKIIQLRVHDGDDASCLNLNRAQKPRLLGVEPQHLQKREAFGFVDVIEGTEKKEGWSLLSRRVDDNVVPAVGDYATVVWALGMNVADELDYSDERGRKFQLRLVAMLKNSILQGSLVIADDEFVRRFPSEEGYRMFLVDAAPEKAEQVMEKLSAALTDFGLELTPATQRLAEFNAVENTYLSIFQLLGGLGLVLGSVGLGLVVLRNVLDRRAELAMMQAVGVGKDRLKKMVLYEHAGLLVLGLLCGVVAALVAVGPVLRPGGAMVPYVSLTATVAGIAISGVIWIWVATVFALGGRVLDALRNE